MKIMLFRVCFLVALVTLCFQTEMVMSAKIDEVREWSYKEVGEWLNSVGYHHLAHAFANEKIDGQALLEITADDLKELGVTKLGDRKSFLRMRNEKLKSVGDEVFKEILEKMEESAPSKEERNAAPKRTRNSPPPRRPSEDDDDDKNDEDIMVDEYDFKAPPPKPKPSKRSSSPPPPPPPPPRPTATPKKQTARTPPPPPPPPRAQSRAKPASAQNPLRKPTPPAPSKLGKCLPSDKELMRRSILKMTQCIEPYQGLKDYTSEVVIKMCRCLSDFENRVAPACIEEFKEVKELLKQYEASVGPTCRETRKMEETDDCKAEDLTEFAAGAMDLQKCLKESASQDSCGCVTRLLEAPKGCRTHPAMRRLWSEIVTRMGPMCPNQFADIQNVRRAKTINGSTVVPCMSLVMDIMKIDCLRDHIQEKLTTYSQNVIGALCNPSCKKEADRFVELFESCDPVGETDETLLLLRTVSVNLKGLCLRLDNRWAYEDFYAFRRLLKTDKEGNEDTDGVGKKISSMLADQKSRMKILAKPIPKEEVEEVLRNQGLGKGQSTIYTEDDKRVVCSPASRAVFRIYVDGGVINRRLLAGLNILCAEGKITTMEDVTEDGELLQEGDEDFGDVISREIAQKSKMNPAKDSFDYLSKNEELQMAIDKAAKKRVQENNAAKKKQEEDAAKKKAEELKKQQADEAAKKKADEAAAAKKRAEENKKKADEAAAKKRAEEAKKKQQADEEAAKRAEEEKREEAAAKKKAEEEAAAAKKKATEAAAKKKAEEAKKKAEEAAAKKKAEEAKKKKAADEAAKKKGTQAKKKPAGGNQQSGGAKAKQEKQYGDKNTPPEDLGWTTDL
eukprot:PhF_6_TR44223/c2_g1_i2/m.67945